MERLAGSSIQQGLGGRALTAGRDAFMFALTCRRLRKVFIDTLLTNIEYDAAYLLYPKGARYVASLVKLAGLS